MQHFTLRINRKLAGIKEVRQGGDQSSEYSEARLEDLQKRMGHQIPKKITPRYIKQLNDRIKILEMELQKAREESFRAGCQEGRDSMKQEAGQQIENAMNELRTVEKKFIKAIEAVEEPLLNIALKMAREVIGHELEHTENYRDIIYARLGKMLQKLVDQHKVIISVHPDHVADLNEKNLNADFGLPKNMEINTAADPQMKKSEAFVKTEDFYIDGRHDVQLEELHEQLKNRSQ